MLKISGQYRVIGIYTAAESAKSYVTLKCLDDMSMVKFGVVNPLPPVLKDDALLLIDGVVETSLYGNNVGLTLRAEFKQAKPVG